MPLKLPKLAGVMAVVITLTSSVASRILPLPVVAPSRLLGNRLIGREWRALNASDMFLFVPSWHW
jgi:hypothetical protein